MTILQCQAIAMLISELAHKSGLSIDTIRFYEKKGLIGAEPIRRHRNNYRDYDDRSVERLQLIQQAKRLGFTLLEIKEWIADFESDRLSSQQKRSILGRKLEQIEERIESLRQMKIYLAEKLARLEDAGD